MLKDDKLGLTLLCIYLQQRNFQPVSISVAIELVDGIYAAASCVE